jgi:hypothetical protein
MSKVAKQIKERLDAKNEEAKALYKEFATRARRRSSRARTSPRTRRRSTA